jgi:hypothetical protein
MSVSGVGPGPQPVEVAAPSKQAGDLEGQLLGPPVGGISVAAGASSAHEKLPDGAGRGLLLGQPVGGGAVAGSGPGTQLLEVAAFGEQLGKPAGGVAVAGVGGAAVEGDGVAVEQPVVGAAGELDDVGRVVDVGDQGVPGAGRDTFRAADLGGVVEEVLGDGVAGQRAHAGCDRFERGDPAV